MGRRLSLRLRLGAPFVALLLLAAGCAGRQQAAFQRMDDWSYPPRAEPAEVRPGPVRDLTGEGYLPIGWVSVRQPLRHCWGTRCRDYSHEEEPTAVARRLAAERGGDLLVLEKDGALEREVREGHGRCRVPDIRGPLAPRSSPFVPADCLEYEIVPELIELRVSEGFVWRREPERARGAAGRLSRRLFGEEPEPGAQPREGPQAQSGR